MVRFVNSLGLTFNPYVTQVYATEPTHHATYPSTPSPQKSSTMGCSPHLTSLVCTELRIAKSGLRTSYLQRSTHGSRLSESMCGAHSYVIP